MTAASRLAQIALIVGLVALADALRRAWPDDAPPFEAGDGDCGW